MAYIYTEEQKQFLKNNYLSFTCERLTDMFNRCFDANKSSNAIRGYCHALGLFKYTGRKPYTKEQKQFLKDNYQNVSHKKLTDMFNQRFGTNKSVDAIKVCCNIWGFVKYNAEDPYTDEQKKFLKDNYQNVSRKELTDMFNQRFGTNKTVIAIKLCCNNLGFVKYNAEEPYTDEQKQFLKDNYQNVSHKELTDMFNQRFGTNKTVKAIEGFCNIWGFVKYKAEDIQYTKEQKQFLKDNCLGITRRKLTDMFNKRFCTNKTVDSITDVCYRNGYKNELPPAYTEEQLDFLKDNFKLYSYKDLTFLLNTLYTTDKTVGAVKNCCKRLGLRRNKDIER